MNLLLNLRPKNSGNVRDPRFLPILRVLLPKNTKAMKTPTKIFKNTSHSIPIPYLPATPPKPTIAAVEMKVAP